MTELAHSPYTGAGLGAYPTSSAVEVDAAVSGAASIAPAVSDTAPGGIAGWLDAVADALITHRDGLAELADSETGLGQERLTGEVERAANQLRFYGSVAKEGSYLGATLDTTPAPSPPSASLLARSARSTTASHSPRSSASSR